MKLKLFIIAMAFVGTTVWAENTPSIPTVSKDTVLKELKSGCLESGNTDKACDCSIDNFDKKLTKEEWALLLTPPKKITEEDFTKFKDIEGKMIQVITDCGATNQ